MPNFVENHERLAWDSLTSEQRAVLEDLFSHQQIGIILLHIKELRGLPFFIDIGQSLKNKDIILDNLRNFQSIIKMSDYEIKRLEQPKSEEKSIDIYLIRDIIEEFEKRQADLENLLQRYDVNRIIIPFNNSITLHDYESIVRSVRSVLSNHFGEAVADKLTLDLDSFLRKEILGIYPFQHKQIQWTGPVKAHLSSYLVYSAEMWVMSAQRQFVPLIGLFGFTDKERTNIQGQEYMFSNRDTVPLSAAFTFHKGLSIPLGVFYDSLGRNMLGQYASEVEKWFEMASKIGHGVYRYENPVPYSATPFSVPIDVIFYPHSEEFGIKTETFYNPNYLRPSLIAKVMIKLYFEKITSKRFPIEESLTINYLKDFAK